MGSFAKKDILDLSVSERIQLVQDIRDSIAQVPELYLLQKKKRQKLIADSTHIIAIQTQGHHGYWFKSGLRSRA